jgi:hypothetical protein
LYFFKCLEGHDAIDSNRIFDENDWTNLDSTDVTNYPRSKTLAERAAWDYVKDIKGIFDQYNVYQFTHRWQSI